MWRGIYISGMIYKFTNYCVMAAAPREVGASAAWCSRCGWDRGCIVCYDKSAAWHWIRLLSVLGFGKICWVLILHCHIVCRAGAGHRSDHNVILNSAKTSMAKSADKMILLPRLGPGDWSSQLWTRDTWPRFLIKRVYKSEMKIIV